MREEHKGGLKHVNEVNDDYKSFISVSPSQNYDIPNLPS